MLRYATLSLLTLAIDELLLPLRRQDDAAEATLPLATALIATMPYCRVYATLR